MENISLAFRGIWDHKMRSFLTMLGIIIGIAAIITIVSTIKGANEQIKANLVGAGNNVVTVQLYQDDWTVDMSYQPLPQGVTPVDEDTRLELSKLDGVEGVSVYNSRSYCEGVYYRNTAFNGSVYGIDEHYLGINGYRLSYGRGFVADDYAKSRKVALLDAKAVGSLFEGGDPIGCSLELQGEVFTVVGVVDLSGSFSPTIETLSDYYMYADTSAGSIFIPDSCWSIVYRFDEPQTVCLQARSTDDMTSVGNGAAEILNDRHIADPDGVYSFRSEDLLEQAKELQDLSASTNQQLIWIAGISLLVGGIGVMNIMLVSVTERTREIGLKKAIGAKRRRILWQFLTEAVVLTSTGGILGVVSGIGVAKLLSNAMGTPSAVSIPAGLIAVGFSMFIGILFGLLPAVKASKLNPITALRHE